MKPANEMTVAEAEKLAKKIKREKWETMFARQLEAEGFVEGDRIPLMPGEYVREHKWHPKRKWRADFLISAYLPGKLRYMNSPDQSFLAEIEGGVWTRGRHTRGSGFIKDCEKYNTAAACGHKVFRFHSGMVEDESAIEWLKENVWR